MNKSYRAARVRSASYNEESNTIDIVWSTGANVVRSDGYEEFIERLLMGAENVRLDRLNSGAPFLNTHSSDDLGDVIGVVVEGSAKIENGRGIAKIQLSSAAADVDTIQKIREGVIKNVSVGYWIHHSTRQEGGSGEPDIIEVDDWEPLEVSAVPVPADADATIRSATSRKAKRRSPAERAASYARRLLGQATQSREQAKGAGEARKALRSNGDLDQAAVARGARMARRLLRKRV